MTAMALARAMQRQLPLNLFLWIFSKSLVDEVEGFGAMPFSFSTPLIISSDSACESAIVFGVIFVVVVSAVVVALVSDVGDICCFSLLLSLFSSFI